ncbi:MAG TPA: CHAT domain-containing protein [Bacteroidales bacterium]|nr:CHAT domain-containing protein [Bacteroidales bacterium]
MKKISVVLGFWFIFTHSAVCQTYKQEANRLYEVFVSYYYAGDFIKAEESLIKTLELPLDELNKCTTLSNLASIYSSIGRYDEALKYLNQTDDNFKRPEVFFSQPEKIKVTKDMVRSLKAFVYINKAICYQGLNSNYNAKEYYEQSIRLLLEIEKLRTVDIDELISAYSNFGTYYLNLGEFEKALKYFNKSIEIENKYDLPSSLETVNIARIYANLKQNDKADEYFREGINQLISIRGDNNYRLGQFNIYYGSFLEGIGKINEAYKSKRSALKIFSRTFGEKNTNTSRSYKYLGDFYLLQSQFDSAFFYYQKSLISIVDDFNETDIYKNPRIDSAFSETRLLDNLKSKSNAFEKYSESIVGEDKKLKNLKASLEAIDLAVRLIENIKNSLLLEDNNFFIIEDEKETYLSAIRIASKIYSLNNDGQLLDSIYGYAQLAKASMLRDQISEKEMLFSGEIPDSLKEKQRQLSSGVAFYNKLLNDEESKTQRDSLKISSWKDEVFRMNREKEIVDLQIESFYPGYEELKKRIKPITFEQISDRLGKDETLIDYVISNHREEGNRKLYIFVINRKGLIMREVKVDSVFDKHALTLKNISDPILSRDMEQRFLLYTSALNYMYKELISPVESLINGDRIKIIPDEEIGWLPFEAFLREMPDSTKKDFEGLDFLINDYVISYGYSASLIPEKNEYRKPRYKVYAYSPSYSYPDSLEGAMSEIKEISRMYEGESYFRREATKENFLNHLSKPAVFHLAMHSISDTVNSFYSYLLFSGGKDDSTKLFNYEISLSEIKSPMIVLSSCNTGAGTLYAGEGLMSIARSFMLAGASSVVRTSWEVNDESGSAIITRFYYYLSKGKHKDEALKLAKTEFIKNSPPSFSDPYYWAAYGVLGDTGKIKNNRIMIVSVITIFILSSFIYYLRRRKIF